MRVVDTSGARRAPRHASRNLRSRLLTTVRARPVLVVAVLLAATSLGTLFYVGSRIDALAARMVARFDRVDARFDHMEERFDSLTARFDAHLDRPAG